jgi:hypothetical protein
MKTSEQLLADLMRANQRRRTVTMLTDVLMLGLRIPVGSQLVLVLGDGSARDNRDAVYSWVMGQLDELTSLTPLQLKAELLGRLHRQLVNAQQEMLIH